MDIPYQIGTLFALCGKPGQCDWTSLNTWKHVSCYCYVYKIGLTCLWKHNTKRTIMSAMWCLRLSVSLATLFSPRRVSFVQEGIKGRNLVRYVATQFWFRLGWAENQPPLYLRFSGMRILLGTSSVVLLKQVCSDCRRLRTGLFSKIYSFWCCSKL